MLARLTLATVALLCWTAASAQTADRVFPTGSRVGIVPPPGMVASKSFQGFEDAGQKVTMIFTELAGSSISDVARQLDPDGLKAGGAEIDAEEHVKLEDGAGFLMIVRQRGDAIPMRRWVQAVVMHDITAIVTILVPDEARNAYSDAALRAALATVAVRPTVPVDEQLAVLPFRIKDMGGFRLMRASPDGGAAFTLGPEDTTVATDQPFFLVSFVSAQIPEPEFRERFARRVLAETWGFKDLRLVRSETIRMGGRQMHEIVAEGIDGKNGLPLGVVQWLRFGHTGFMRMLGIARREVWASVFPNMRSLRDGIEPK